ncbi:hypothetical protein DNTS_020224 [Danionella cerebrum]|uniref:C2H2-type domain-containing protein n=1 Tax=Danionella cerebrum TaxID=2873325 RepID=A0A553RCJ5_9TELE|nr:hypothetical protein DNTS_020224 [Danionella translucida]
MVWLFFLLQSASCPPPVAERLSPVAVSTVPGCRRTVPGGGGGSATSRLVIPENPVHGRSRGAGKQLRQTRGTADRSFCCSVVEYASSKAGEAETFGRCCHEFKRDRSRDLQRCCRCWKMNSLLSNSLVPLEESQIDVNNGSLLEREQSWCKTTEEGSLRSSKHLSVLRDLPDDYEKQQPEESVAHSMAEFTCTDSETQSPLPSGSILRPKAASSEKRKSSLDGCLEISKKIKYFDNVLSRGCPQTQFNDSSIGSRSEIQAFPSEKHQKEMNVKVGHSMLLEATITAAVQRVFQCSFCHKSFVDLEALQEHVHQSHNSALDETKLFFCSQCFCGFLTEDALDNHVEGTHSRNRNLKLDPDAETTERNSLQFCQFYSHVPSTNRKVLQHIKTPKNTRLVILNDGTTGLTSPQSKAAASAFICDHCGAKYTDPDLFQSHLSSHLSSSLPKRTSPEGLNDFPNRDSLEKHTMCPFIEASTLYICESCSKTFSSVKDLQGHLLEMHTIVLYRCSLCQQAFSSKVSIQVHLASEHSNKRTTFQCTSCDWDFKQESDLHLHVKQKHLDRQWQDFCCIFCTESFATDVELQCHITTHSKTSNRCVCTNTRSPPEVPLHSKLHAKCQSTEGNNMTPPPVSKAAAKDRLGLLPVNSDTSRGKLESMFGPSTESKEKVNLNDPMFACEICGASYTMQALLTKHQLRDHHILPEERGNLKRKVEAIQGSHKCKDCSKTFFTEMALWEHVQTHLGPTKHCQCPICGERFPSLLTLTEHKVTHSRSLDTGNCRICKLPLHSEEDFLEHCQKHPDLHNSLTGFRCVVCMQTVTSTLELKIHGTFHMQKVQTEGVTNSRGTDCAVLNPDLKISSGAALQEAGTRNVSLFEHRFRDRNAGTMVSCCSATALARKDFLNKNSLTQTTTV